jgi:hypothetical protein
MSLVQDLKKLVGGKPRYPHVERDLAQAYGIAADAIKDVRSSQLHRGEHWDLVRGLVCYNEAGKGALEIALKITPEKNSIDPVTGMTRNPDGTLSGVPDAVDPVPTFAPPKPDSAPNTPPPAAAEPSKKFAAPIAGEIRTLVAVAKVRNKRILKARDADRVAWVRVKDSKNFRPGMELQAAFVSGEQWELVGRCPRWNGKF